MPPPPLRNAPDRGVERGARTPADLAMLLLAMGLGLALIAFSVPRFLGALEAREARSVLISVRMNRYQPDSELARAIGALEASTRWSGTPAYTYSDLATLKLLRLRTGAYKDLSREELLAQIIEDQEAALALAPAGHNGWARLAAARYELSGMSPAVEKALEMSFLTGGVDFTLVLFRLEFVLRQWDALGEDLREAGRGEILQLARHGRAPWDRRSSRTRGYDALVDLYLRSERGEIIRETLATDAKKLAVFERLLARRNPE